MTSELSSWTRAISLSLPGAQLPLPDTTCQGLDRVGRPRPLKHLRQQRRHQRDLVGPLRFTVDLRRVVGLVPQIPAQDPGVVAEQADDAGDVVQQHFPVLLIPQQRCTRSAPSRNCARREPARAGSQLGGVRVPAGIEQHEQRFDAVAGRDADELRELAREAGTVLHPQLIVQEHSHGVEADLLGDAKFAVDAARVVRA